MGKPDAATTTVCLGRKVLLDLQRFLSKVVLFSRLPLREISEQRYEESNCFKLPSGQVYMSATDSTLVLSSLDSGSLFQSNLNLFLGRPTSIENLEPRIERREVSERCRQAKCSGQFRSLASVATYHYNPRILRENSRGNLNSTSHLWSAF